MPSNINSQSQSKLIAIEENANGGAPLDTKDHLAFVVDGHKTERKDATFMEFFFYTYYVLRPKLEMDGKDKNLEVIQMPLWKGTMVQLQRLGRKLVRFQRRVRLIRNWRRHHKKSMRTTFNSSWNHRKTKKLERQRNLKSKI